MYLTQLCHNFLKYLCPLTNSSLSGTNVCKLIMGRDQIICHREQAEINIFLTLSTHNFQNLNRTNSVLLKSLLHLYNREHEVVSFDSILPDHDARSVSLPGNCRVWLWLSNTARFYGLWPRCQTVSLMHCLFLFALKRSSLNVIWMIRMTF